MEVQTVTHAIEQLQAQGEQPSVRKIHGLVGGSFRDITRHLKALVTPEETPMVTETAPDAVLTPPVGKLAQARDCLEEIEARFHAAQARTTHLARELLVVERAPLPDIVTGLQLTDRDAQVHNLQRALAGAQAQMRSLQREVTKARAVLQQCAGRARDLPRLIEHCQRNLAPTGLYGQRVREAEHRAALLRREYEQKQQELATLEAELHALTGAETV